MSDELKNMILGYVDDLVGSFLYYDRKEDEDLPMGAIEEAIDDGVVTIEDMVAAFEASLREGLGEVEESLTVAGILAISDDD